MTIRRMLVTVPYRAAPHHANLRRCQPRSLLAAGPAGAPAAGSATDAAGDNSGSAAQELAAVAAGALPAANVGEQTHGAELAHLPEGVQASSWRFGVHVHPICAGTEHLTSHLVDVLLARWGCFPQCTNCTSARIVSGGVYSRSSCSVNARVGGGSGTDGAAHGANAAPGKTSSSLLVGHAVSTAEP